MLARSLECIGDFTFILALAAEFPEQPDKLQRVVRECSLSRVGLIRNRTGDRALLNASTTNSSLSDTLHSPVFAHLPLLAYIASLPFAILVNSGKAFVNYGQ